ncbi:MAG TPA: VanW family protein [Pseudobdellovibrionaceae bacterium]|nr:VanW family protein [Pseudobdellovibrionaceae bacterium]
MLRSWVNFECPIVNHPTQQHLLDAKLHNMRVAVERLDGLIIEPDQIVSFWRFIGAPTESRGFVSGPTFEDGRVVSTFGGGLCQISGLLFNLALESGCEVIERHSHSLDAYGERRYLPLGRDATVAWISKDLCFRNTTGVRLRLSVGVDRHRAFGRIEADAPMEFKIKIDSEISQENLDRKRIFVTTIQSISRRGSDWRKLRTFTSEYKTLTQN